MTTTHTSSDERWSIAARILFGFAVGLLAGTVIRLAFGVTLTRVTPAELPTTPEPTPTLTASCWSEVVDGETIRSCVG